VAEENLADGQSSSNGPTLASAGPNSRSAAEKPQQPLSDSARPSTKSSGAAAASLTLDSSQITSEDDIYRPSMEWRKKGAMKAHRKAWSATEEELVYKGVQKYGVGNWASIHSHFVPNRTNVDIKDKWRTMERQGHLYTLEKKLGPLS